jgi:surface protein
MSSSGLKYGSGKEKFIGSGLTANLAIVDATLYKGSLAFADDNAIYISDGFNWEPLQPPVIRRPSAIEAITQAERRLLRITPFAPGLNYEGKIYYTRTSFYISLNPDMSDRIKITTTDGAQLTLARPDGVDGVDGLTLTDTDNGNTLKLYLSDTFYWQAEYYANYYDDPDVPVEAPLTDLPTEPSAKSKTQTQVFTDYLIDIPSSVTLSGAETTRVTLSDFSSPFGLSFSSSVSNYAEFRVYEFDNDMVKNTGTALTPNNFFSVTNLNLDANMMYEWEGRYVLPGVASSPYSEKSQFKIPYPNLVFHIDTNLNPSTDPTIERKFNVVTSGTNGTTVTIDWGDGIVETYANDGNRTQRPHFYSEHGTYRIEVSGNVTTFGPVDSVGTVSSELANSQLMIVNCQSFGANLNITNLSTCFFNSTSLQDVPAYLPRNIAGLNRMFAGANSFNSPSVRDWNISTVTDISGIFQNCTLFNQDISKWDTRNVLFMNAAFQNARNFNANISFWNVSGVINWPMTSIFDGATSFNRNLNRWDVSRVSGFNSAFRNATLFTGNVSTWDVSTATDMANMFSGATNFNGNISTWDTSKVTSMSSMFASTLRFNQNINTWDVSKVTNMSSMFSSANSFNQNLNLWNTGAVVAMSSMFLNARNFTGNISSWNTSNVTSMSSMFNGASKYSQNLNSWNTGNVTTMASMFSGASTFNGNVMTWDTSKVTDMTSMFQSATRMNSSLNWNTGNVTTMASMFNAANSFNSNIYFSDTSKVTSMASMFASARTFNQNLDSWNTGNVTLMTSMFSVADNFNGNVSTWNTSKVTSMASMFSTARTFNKNLYSWNTSNVTSMSNMFNTAASFNQDINSWDTSKVTSMTGMFARSYAFNQNLHSWNTGNVTNMSAMFQNARIFNGNVSTWNTSKVTDMSAMFNGGSATPTATDSAPKLTNLDLTRWNTSNVTTMASMFFNNTTFSGNVSTWNTGNVTLMSRLFLNNYQFNSNISNWNTSSVTNMSEMFRGANSFNQNVSSWNVSNVSSFAQMFQGQSSSVLNNFDQDLSNWTLKPTSTIVTMNFMFNNSRFSNTNMSRLLISFANKASAASNQPPVAFGDMSDKFYKTGYKAADLLGPYQDPATAQDAVIYLTTASSEGGSGWSGFNLRQDNTP